MLNDQAILNLSSLSEKPLISPFHQNNLQAHSYDCLLDNRFKVATYDNYKKSWNDITIDDPKKDLVIKPGRFILASTVEYFCLPRDIVGFVQGKSTIGRNGLEIQNAGLIDAGFSGSVTLELYNMAPWPISLTPGMKICQIHFTRTDKSKIKHYDEIGSYNGQKGPREPKYLI